MGSLERPKNNHFERKMRDGKKVKKKNVKGIASEGHAMAGKEGLGWMGQARSSTPSPMGMGGRIVYALCIPPRP